MKPEEAIKILQGRIDLTKKVWSNVPEIIEYREALELAVKALEKQIPKKPIIYPGTNRADCPICMKTVRGIGKPFGKHCAGCGQKLDWGEENGR